ncbi:MAG: lipopolysaccharide biosynthesis protein [Deltaproteobacteria bacterium]|nr:lipopolysaccharide biosynthesis protein [Deltaproteobacteria bacterium]
MDHNTQPPARPPDYVDDEIHLTDYLIVLLKRKRVVLGVTFLAALFSIIVSLLMTNRYTATARILPPQESTPGISGLVSQVGGVLGGLAAGLPGSKTTSEVYVGILESRSAADFLIQKFKLKEYYDQKLLDSVYKELASRTKIQVSRKAQIVSVSVEDADPEKAAQMANAYIEALDRINRTVNITEGHRKRVFLEKRLEKVKEDLTKAENDLREFQEKFKLVALEEQAKATIEGAARIKGEIIVAQTELEVLRQFGTERQNEAVMLKSKIEELHRQLAKIESGNPGKDLLKEKKGDKAAMEFYIPFDELPILGLQLARLIREAKIQEEVFKLLTSQHELAKIEEAKDVNTIQVLDRAKPPDRKSSPRRAMIVMLSAIIAFFLAIFLAFFLEYVDRLKAEDNERYQELVRYLRFGKAG